MRDTFFFPEEGHRQIKNEESWEKYIHSQSFFHYQILKCHFKFILFISMFMCGVYMCSSVCGCMCRVTMHTSGVFLHHSPPYVLRQCLLWTWELANLASLLQGSPVSFTFSRLGLWVGHHVHQFCKSLRFHDKCFMNFTISPAPNVALFKVQKPDYVYIVWLIKWSHLLPIEI